MYVFWMPKPSESTVRVSKIKVLGVPQKHQKMTNNETPKRPLSHQFGPLWRPLGGQGVIVRPLGVDFKVSQK